MNQEDNVLTDTTLTGGSTLPVPDQALSSAPESDAQEMTASETGLMGMNPLLRELSNPDAELTAMIAEQQRVKTVRDLIGQRIAEAVFEQNRLQNLLNTSPQALLDAPLALAQAIFG